MSTPGGFGEPPPRAHVRGARPRPVRCDPGPSSRALPKMAPGGVSRDRRGVLRRAGSGNAGEVCPQWHLRRGGSPPGALVCWRARGAIACDYTGASGAGDATLAGEERAEARPGLARQLLLQARRAEGGLNGLGHPLPGVEGGGSSASAAAASATASAAAAAAAVAAAAAAIAAAAHASRRLDRRVVERHARRGGGSDGRRGAQRFDASARVACVREMSRMASGSRDPLISLCGEVRGASSARRPLRVGEGSRNPPTTPRG